MKIIFALLLTGFSATTVFSQKLNTPKLDSFFHALADNNKAMASIAVSKNGKIIYTNTIGYSYIGADKRTRSGDKTLYRVGSVTKLFTDAITFQLIEEGRISLNTDISGFFPLIPGAKKITIEMLLGHSSGLYDYVNDVADPTWILAPRTRQTIMDTIIRGETHFPPGGGVSYCNSGFFLLACIIEKITGKSYAENVQERICNKIGLAMTKASAANEANASINVAKAYSYANGQWKQVKDAYLLNTVGAGDVVSTPKDLIVFEEALLKGRIISEKSLALMMGNPDSAYGLDIEKIPFNGKMSYGHSGDIKGHHSILFHFPADTMTIAVCLNGEGIPHYDVFYGIVSICLNEPYKIPSFKTVKVPLTTLKAYAGSYSSAELPFKIKVTNKNGVLYAKAAGQAPFALDAEDVDRFTYLPAKIVLEFDRSKEQMTMRQYGKSFSFMKEK